MVRIDEIYNCRVGTVLGRVHLLDHCDSDEVEVGGAEEYGEFDGFLVLGKS